MKTKLMLDTLEQALHARSDTSNLVSTATYQPEAHLEPYPVENPDCAPDRFINSKAPTAPLERRSLFI